MADVVGRGFRVLFVCTGNICRSAFAEVLTRHLLRETLGDRHGQRFSVRSAGVQAVVGGAMHPRTREELAPWGLDDSAPAGTFVARQLDPAMLLTSDLVLTATAAHRASVIRALPSVAPRAFPLLEFAHLMSQVDGSRLPLDPVARAVAIVARADAERARQRPRRADLDDVPDPISGPAAAHHRSAQVVGTAVRTVVAALGRAVVGHPPGVGRHRKGAVRTTSR